MVQNPLQQYFRQPKVFISLPTHGVYNKSGFVNGDVDHIPVFGMTGMDEILVKTPDALLTGESTVRVISSCCPNITDPWSLTILDLDAVLTAIRIATYGNMLNLTQICPKCSTDNDYDFDMATFIEYYNNCKYDNKVVIGELTVYLKPLSYKQSSEYSLKNFQLQQTLSQISDIKDSEEKNTQLAAIFGQLAELQNEIFIAGIETVDTSSVKVSEKGFIREWVENCDAALLESIKEKIRHNQEVWRSPDQKTKCDNCGHESFLNITLDQADFFVAA